MVRVVTDSTADIPAGLVSSLDIVVVPCQVFWGNRSYLDGVDLLPDEFHRRLAQSSEIPRTSQPAVGRFVETYRYLLSDQRTDAVVSIHVAGSLSGTLNAAWAAAQGLGEPSRVSVVDSGQLSMGLGWAVVEAARMAQDGADQERVVESVIELLPRLRTVLLSGWANSDKTRYRYGADQAIALSDHADFDELLEFVQRVNPKKVYCTHGLEKFPHHLKRIGFDAELLKPNDQLSLL